jgi:hypothetical protein
MDPRVVWKSPKQSAHEAALSSECTAATVLPLCRIFAYGMCGASAGAEDQQINCARVVKSTVCSLHLRGLWCLRRHTPRSQRWLFTRKCAAVSTWSSLHVLRARRQAKEPVEKVPLCVCNALCRAALGDGLLSSQLTSVRLSRVSPHSGRRDFDASELTRDAGAAVLAIPSGGTCVKFIVHV